MDVYPNTEAMEFLVDTCQPYTGWAKKSDTSRTYITLYERYHFFGPPGTSADYTTLTDILPHNYHTVQYVYAV